MPDPTDAPDTDATEPHDFASMAIASMTDEPPPAPAPKAEPKAPAAKQPEPKATEPKQDAPKKGIPDALLPKKEEPKEDARKSELDSIPTPEFKDPKRKAQWDELHGVADRNEKKAWDLEKKIADYEKRGKDTEGLEKKLAELQVEREAIARERDEFRQIVRQTSIERDPDFRAKYVDGRKNLIGKASKLVEESGLDAKDVETALNLTGKSRVDALAKIAEELNTFQSGRLGRLIDELDNLDNEAAAKRSDPEKYLAEQERAQAEQQKREEQEYIAHGERSWRDALREAESELEVLKPVEGLDWWNEQADAIRAEAEKDYRNNRDLKKGARLVIEAHAGRVYRQAYLDMRKERDEIAAKAAEQEKELKGIYGKTPSLTGGGARPAGNGEYRDFADRTIETMSGER